MKNALLSGFLTLFHVLTVTSQAPVGDCLGAIPVCQPVYQEDQSPTGGGFEQEINGAFNCMQVELNSIWYSFTVNQSGDFGFLLTPNDPNDDYDWALFNITEANCEDLIDDPSLIVSCNAAGGTGCLGPTGATGANGFDDQGFGCDNNPPNTSSGFSAFNDLVPVVAGNTYVLCVSNWTGSINGYVLDFGLSGDIGIFDETDPVVESFEVDPDCPEEMQLTLSEFVQCSTIAASDISLNGPGGPYTLSLNSVNCDAGGNFAKEFTISIDPPLSTAGSYVFVFDVDGSTDALDLCGNPAVPESFSFIVSNPLAPPELGPDTMLCPGETLVLDATTAGVSYLWQDGSTDPIFEVNTAGLYSVTISQGCYQQSDEVNISFIPPITASLGSSGICEGETLVLDVSTPMADYLWQDGSTASTLTVSEPGNYSVTISTACEVRELGTTLTLSGELPVVNLGADTILCTGDQLLLEVSGSGASLEWQDGSSDPFFLVDQAGLYAVTLTNACGTASDALEVDYYDPILLNLPPDTFLCPGQRLNILAEVMNATRVEWEDGTTGPGRQLTAPGAYRITAGNDCGSLTASITVTECEICEVFIPNVFSPNSDGINDLFLAFSECGAATFSMQIFDRWGALIFESKDISLGWDGNYKGQRLPSGTYVWVVDMTVLEDDRPKQLELSGDVQLLR